jgi:protoheme IX farnesyltransferase
MNTNLIMQYYLLTKPGMVRGNAMIAACAFFFASRGHIDWWLLLEMLVGISLIIAAACVFNNYIDRGIDTKMSRTKNRALVKKLIPKRNALIYGIILAIIGTSILAWYTNLVTLGLAGLGFVFYVIFYSIEKRRSIHGTLVGAISGATPPVIGYSAVTNNFDLGALILFIILIIWQMPHFFAIALYRYDDYAAANIPVLPVKKGINETKAVMLLYIIAFTVATLALNFFGYAGTTYLIVAGLLSSSWLLLWTRGVRTTDTKRWARKMFFLSLIILMGLFVTLAIEGISYRG